MPEEPIVEYPPFSIELLKTGFFMLYENDGSKFGNLIQNEQRILGIPLPHAKYTHVDILGPRQWAISVNPPRASLVEIDVKQRGRRAAMFRYLAPDYEVRRKYVAWWAATLNGKMYDWFGIAKFKIKFLFHQKRWKFCSEGAADSLRMEYPFSMQDPEFYPNSGKIIPSYRIVPAHFSFLKEFEKVWEGVIG